MTREEAFTILDRMARGIAEMFGPSCETILHDFSLPSHPVLAIYNGHVSQRSVGSTLDLTGRAQEVAFEGDVINLLATTPRGQQVKSSTFSFVGEDYHLALGINFDVTALAHANNALLELMRTDVDFQSAVYPHQEAGIAELFAQAMEKLGKSVGTLNKADRLWVVRFLRERGAFSYRRAVPFVAHGLGVSRYTIYKYIDQVNAETEQEEQGGDA